MIGGAGVLLVRGDGAYLLLRRSSGVDCAGYWNLPGGGIDPGEEPMDAAYREFREEAGPLPRARVLSTQIYDGFFIVVAAISAREAARWEPQLNWESDQWGWFPATALPTHLYHGLGPWLHSLVP